MYAINLEMEYEIHLKHQTFFFALSLTYYFQKDIYVKIIYAKM